MTRRDLLRLLSLSVLATTGGTLLAGCGEKQAKDPTGSGSDAGLVSADVPRAPGDRAAIPAVVAAMHASGGALLGEVAKTMDGNLALSPYSICVALAMTLNGAMGETRDQLAIVLGGADTDAINAGLGALTTEIESYAGPVKKQDGTNTELELDAANALFGQGGVTWEEPFLEGLAAGYGAGMHTVDYVGDTEGARTAVNAWTSEQTHDKIPEILPDGSVDVTTRLVLVNTLYLKAPWESPFEKDLTADHDFTLADGDVVPVPLMEAYEPNGDASARGDGWQAARMLYAGGDLAMTVVLPDSGRFAEIEADVVAGGPAPYLEALAPGAAQVTLPKFTFRTQAPLKDPLIELGVVVPFADADFSGMTRDLPLYVSAVLHEVFVAVDEEGTEAAAATAVVMGEASATAPPSTVLVVDRPFLFVVHDVTHATPLFVGRVLDPR